MPKTITLISFIILVSLFFISTSIAAQEIIGSPLSTTDTRKGTIATNAVETVFEFNFEPNSDSPDIAGFGSHLAVSASDPIEIKFTINGVEYSKNNLPTGVIYSNVPAEMLGSTAPSDNFGAINFPATYNNGSLIVRVIRTSGLKTGKGDVATNVAASLDIFSSAYSIRVIASSDEIQTGSSIGVTVDVLKRNADNSFKGVSNAKIVADINWGTIHSVATSNAETGLKEGTTINQLAFQPYPPIDGTYIAQLYVNHT